MKLTESQRAQLDCQFQQTPALDDHDAPHGQHMVLIALLNSFGFNPRGREEAMELAESLLNEDC